MNTRDQERILGLFHGFWGDMTDARSAAYADWLSRCPSTASDVEKAVRKLAEDTERLPSISTLVTELREMSAYGGRPQDPVESWTVWLKGDDRHPGAIQNLMNIHNISRDEALRELLAAAKDDQRQFSGLSEQSDASYRHRIAAIEKAMAEGGGRLTRTDR